MAQQYLAAAQIQGNPSTDATAGFKYKTAYDDLVAAANDAALPDVIDAARDAYNDGGDRAESDQEEQVKNYTSPTAGQNIKIKRDAWMVSGKIKMGGPVDIRFSYMDAEDLEVSCGSCSGDWDETAADAWNVGIFYTMPAGTELRLTYSEVDNDDEGTYGQGISGTGLGGVSVPGGSGGEIEMFAVGIVHWFD